MLAGQCIHPRLAIIGELETDQPCVTGVGHPCHEPRLFCTVDQLDGAVVTTSAGLGT